MALFVGTSGWAYKEWKGGFYPPDLAEARFLEYYARVLDACEVNATFYRLQSEKTFSRWAETTPASFRFAVKAHRRLTHSRSLAPSPGSEAFQETFSRSLQALGDRLACVLFQFPPDTIREDAELERLLEALPSQPPPVLEFQDESWEAEQARRQLEEAGVSVCLSDSTGTPPRALPPGPIAYVRLRAPRYDEDQRAEWLALLEREGERRDVYAFAKHEGVPAGDPFAGVGLAQWLVQNSST
jgi:uncharacterized protein YecE (DUF72 family)